MDKKQKAIIIIGKKNRYIVTESGDIIDGPLEGEIPAELLDCFEILEDKDSSEYQALVAVGMVSIVMIDIAIDIVKKGLISESKTTKHQDDSGNWGEISFSE